LIIERVRRMFDLGADPAEIARRLRHDALLRPAVEAHPGLRVPGAWDGFELAVRAVLGQQISVKAATTLAGRLVKAFGTPRESPREDSLAFFFPAPVVLAGADLSSISLNEARTETIRGLAKAVSRGLVTFASSREPDAFVRELTALPGIGQWTAQYVVMRALNEPDAFPSSDLGLLLAASNRKTRMTPKALEQRAEAWRPWRAYAAMYLWRTLTA
jgi:AraC family transcriptional regulator of adaptative response / DNA-3-methyladenine glycosylase II